MQRGGRGWLRRSGATKRCGTVTNSRRIATAKLLVRLVLVLLVQRMLMFWLFIVIVMILQLLFEMMKWLLLLLLLLLLVFLWLFQFLKRLGRQKWRQIKRVCRDRNGHEKEH